MKKKPVLELADIVYAHGREVGDLSFDQQKVLRNIAVCRTEEAGSHVLQCDCCETIKIAFNSCRNRHCPKCQNMKKEQWIVDRQKEILPVHYFHMVFTISDCLYPILLQNKEVGYNILFKAVAYTLKKIGADPKHLGGDLGYFSILHTWNQKLLFHPHIHCVVAGGALSKDQSSWIPSAKEYFLPVKVLSRIFQAKILKLLEKAHKKGQLFFWGDHAGLSFYSQFKSLLVKSAQKPWVVFSKRPFQGPRQVIGYLSRYTHRIAISNYRLLALKDGMVTFKWLDRSNPGKAIQKVMTIKAVDFIKRFLLHILPSGFVKIRFYGFMGHRVKKKLLAHIHFLITGEEMPYEQDSEIKETWNETYKRITGVDLLRCKKCKKGRLNLSQRAALIVLRGNSPPAA